MTTKRNVSILLAALFLAALFLAGFSPHRDSIINAVWTFQHGLTVTGGIVDLSGASSVSAPTTREIQLPLAAAVVEASGPISTSTVPGIEIDDLLPNIVWADGETSSAQITFRTPADYSSGGAFLVLATESDSTTPNQIDFSVYVNSDGTVADSSASNQTPVALAGDTATPDEVTLTVATDFATLAAGDWVTLNIWRDDTAAGTGDLEVKGLVFYYTSAQ